MDIKYVRKIQEWVELDNKVLKTKEEMKEIYDKKKEVEDEILDYVEEHKFDNLSLSISDGTIKFSKRNTTQPLSMKTLKSILEKYSKDHTNLDVNEICDFVSKNMEKKSSICMKRDIM